MLNEDIPKSKYALVQGRWVGVIYREDFLGYKTILSVGEEANRKAIKTWIENYLANRC